MLHLQIFLSTPPRSLSWEVANFFFS